MKERTEHECTQIYQSTEKGCLVFETKTLCIQNEINICSILHKEKKGDILSFLIELQHIITTIKTQN